MASLGVDGARGIVVVKVVVWIVFGGVEGVERMRWGVLWGVGEGLRESGEG